MRWSIKHGKKNKRNVNDMDLTQAKKIMGKNFIGPKELGAMRSKLGIADPLKSRIPVIPFAEQTLKKYHNSAVLILGIEKFKNGRQMTINNMRLRFGINPKKEPCFYNQDWYFKEEFAAKQNLKPQWYLIRKSVQSNTRGKDPNKIKKSVKRSHSFPSALLAVFTFFAYYFHTKGEMLWTHDFIWCSDTDNNRDQIYVGRYHDPKGLSKKGFNIHRHLRIRNDYGLAPAINQ